MLTLAYLPIFAFVIVVSLELFWPRSTDTRSDVHRWLSNIVLYGTNKLGSRGIYLLLFAGGMQFNEAQSFADDGLLKAAGITLAVLVLFDVLDYGKHVLLHRVPVLWRFHQVHHSDSKLDFTSQFRFHPFEMLLSMSLDVSLILLLDIPVYAITFVALIGLTWGMFQHANTHAFKGLDRYARLLLVTPNLHHIHHYTDVAAANKNFGVMFSAWDRLFGSYLSPKRLAADTPQYGVVGLNEKGNLNPFDLLTLPFQASNKVTQVGLQRGQTPIKCLDEEG